MKPLSESGNGISRAAVASLAFAVGLAAPSSTEGSFIFERGSSNPFDYDDTALLRDIMETRIKLTVEEGRSSTCGDKPVFPSKLDKADLPEMVDRAVCHRSIDHAVNLFGDSYNLLEFFSKARKTGDGCSMDKYDFLSRTIDASEGIFQSTYPFNLEAESCLAEELDEDALPYEPEVLIPEEMFETPLDIVEFQDRCLKVFLAVTLPDAVEVETQSWLKRTGERVNYAQLGDILGEEG